MYARGVDIYLAPTWDNSDSWLATLRHIAKEGRVYVVGVAPLLRGSDVPPELRGDLYGGADDWMSRGWSAIVAPGGELLAGPVTEREEILYAEVGPPDSEDAWYGLLRVVLRLLVSAFHPAPTLGAAP